MSFKKATYWVFIDTLKLISSLLGVGAAEAERVLQLRRNVDMSAKNVSISFLTYTELRT